MRSRLALPLSTLLAVTACGTEPNLADIDVETSRSVYATPGVIDASITNRASETVFGLFCPAVIEHRVGHAWEPTVVEDACETVAIAVPPGHTLSTAVIIRDPMAAGEYRLALGGLTNEAGDHIGDVRTNSFRVE